MCRKNSLLLAIDETALTVRKNLCYYMTRPEVRREPVLSPSPFESNAPDNLATHFYGTVLHEEGRFRMWYYACHFGKNPDWDEHHARQLKKHKKDWFCGPLCYAESDDGVEWTKTPLRQVMFKGSKENNVLDLPHAYFGGVTLIRDDDDPDPARRYKMVYQCFPNFADPPIEEYGTMHALATAVSPDGLRWTDVKVQQPGMFFEHASFYKHNGLYIANCHAAGGWMGHASEGGALHGRWGMVRISPDFDNWVDGEIPSFSLEEPKDPEQRHPEGNYDQVHLGTGAASFGNVCVGVFGRWRGNTRKNFERIYADLGLAISNDGITFREPVQGHTFISKEEAAATEVPGKQYHTILTQGNGILNVGDETRIYHGRWRNVGHPEDDSEGVWMRDYRAEIGLATLPRDRWGALGLVPKFSEGLVWSTALRLPNNGGEFTVNADGGDCIEVEVADENFRLLPAFSGENKGTIQGKGGLDCDLRWPGASLTDLAGQTVRLKFSLSRKGEQEPRLYALNLRAK